MSAITLLKSILLYINDFSFNTAADPAVHQFVIEGPFALCRDLGVLIAFDKSDDPSTRPSFFGIVSDSVFQTSSFPEKKLTEFINKSTLFSKPISCSKEELQSIIGTLQFAAKCIPSSRLFMCCMLCTLKDDWQSTSAINLDKDFFEDLRWWQESLPKWNGRSSFLLTDWQSPHSTQLFTDAFSTLGTGGYFDGTWFNLRIGFISQSRYQAARVVAHLSLVQDLVYWLVVGMGIDMWGCKGYHGPKVKAQGLSTDTENTID